MQSLKQTIYAALGSIIYALAQLLVVFYIGHKTGAHTLGLYTLSLSITAPFFMFFCGGIRQFIGTDHESKVKYALPFLTRIIFIVICAFFSIIFALLLDIKNLVPVVFTMCLMKGAEAFFEINYGFFQRSGKNELTSISLALRGIALGGSFVFFLHKSLAFVIFLTTAIWFLIIIFFDFTLMYKEFKRKGMRFLLKPSYKEIKYFVNHTWLCGLNSFEVSLVANIPRYLIVAIADTTHLAVYSSTTYIISTGNIIINSISQGVSLKVAKYYNTNNYKKTLRIVYATIILLILGASICSLLIFAYGEKIFKILFGFSFAEYRDTLFIMAIASSFHLIASFLSNMLVAIRDVRSPATINIVVLFMVILLCFLFSRIYSFQGVVVGVLISYFIQFALTFLRLLSAFR